MYNISIKYKQYFFLLLKTLIVFAACYFIYVKLVFNNSLSFELFTENLDIIFSKNIFTIIAVLLFTDANYFLEIYKWQVLASKEKKISFLESFEQTLAAQTWAIFTPNKLGEYGAKALYFKKESRKKIVLLTFLGNLVQLAATVLFGLLGLWFLFKNKIILLNNSNTHFYDFTFAVLVIIFISIGVVLFYLFLRKKINKVLQYLKQQSQLFYIKIITISIIRYLVFSHQFYVLCYLFGIDLPYSTLILLIFCVYIITAFLPVVAIFDWAVKGSAAVWVFGFYQIDPLMVLTITSLMWLLNFAVPSLLGSVFVLNFKKTNYQ